MHHQSPKQTIAGFTLIELVIYSGLVSLVVGVFLSSAFFLINTNQRDRERQDMVETERFLSGKVHWLLYSTSANKVWVNGGSLYVQRSDGTQLALFVSNGQWQLASASDTNGDGVPDSHASGVALTSSHATVTNSQISIATVNSQKAVQMQLTLQGKNETRTWSQTEYLQ